MQLTKMIDDFENVMNVAEHNGKFVFIDYGYLKDTVDFLKQQLPRVMTYDEVKAAGKSNKYEHLDDRIIFIWLEIRGGKIVLVRPEYSYYHEWDNDYKHCILLDFVNFKFDELFWEKDYGKAWRCWTKRPTKEQRKAAKWDD